MPSKRFQDKVVIITGGNSGIGKATAQLFALEGAKVVISGRDLDRLEEARKLVVRNSGNDENVLVVAGDLLLESVQKELIERTKQKFGRIDILINNAGCSGPDDCQRVGFDLTPEDFDYTMNLNAKVPVTLTSYAMPHLIEAKGAVVNVIDGGASILNPMLIQLNMENLMKTLNNTEEEQLPRSHI
ncbi:hypothetical protein WR25_06296 [Diploscapter pachys]|uniref:Uncharacterized protein n=1 Tax=Diploscapter pachys TaxID=2018661 RepID=A0A2A2JZ45_9BILA|nr:hypothetical protein WR25_06296 [Diploscapter pachys]